MRFACSVDRLPGGAWRARHESRDVGVVEARGASREEAIEKLKGEIRYRLELCPCTGETYQHIDVEIAEKRS
jgi:hypothetical protein